ncbi:hypothetical protein B0G82_3958 [Paraburkholderia sp. BL17N1]|nr:hypothetical protein B0G82_3958 [Paraburkholderia sp. BL17N1]
MQVLGQHYPNGDYTAFRAPVPVVLMGDSLVDCAGIPWAMKDAFGTWVSPTLARCGIRSVVEVSE